MHRVIHATDVDVDSYSPALSLEWQCRISQHLMAVVSACAKPDPLTPSPCSRRKRTNEV